MQAVTRGIRVGTRGLSGKPAASQESGGERHVTSARRRLIPYGLLAPGLLWLVVFFVVPMYFMARISLYEGSSTTGYEFAWNWSNFSDALTEFDTQFLRSFLYSGVATVLALLIAYPLAYAIAFRGGSGRPCCCSRSSRRSSPPT